MMLKSEIEMSLKENMLAACAKIAPAWSLKNMVAVNPFLGFTHKTFGETSQELASLGGIQTTMPAAFYLEKLADGTLQTSDVALVLKQNNSQKSITQFLQSLQEEELKENGFPEIRTRTAVVSDETSKDWERYFVQRISAWAAAYFDAGQAQWKGTFGQEALFQSWRKESMIDRTPDVSGLKSFRNLITELPENPLEAVETCLFALQLADAQQQLYFQRLLRLTGGWSAYLAQLDWQQRLSGQPQTHLSDFLSILICFDHCLATCIGSEKTDKNWLTQIHKVSNYLNKGDLNQSLAIRLILQAAYEKAAQRKLIHQFKNKKTDTSSKKQTLAQAIFCIDVRSEVFRRNLELANGQIETLGFAGFFGFPVEYRSVGETSGEAQCPVLLKPGIIVNEVHSDTHTHTHQVHKKLHERQLKWSLKSFRSGAITCFSYVSPMGWTYLKRLISESFGWNRSTAKRDTKDLILHMHHEHAPTESLPLDQKVQLAQNMLKNLSLTEGLAPWVLIVGHGSSSKNNPQASGLDCGACGGHAGDVNARLAAAVLNDPAVRFALAQKNVRIPTETTFVPCLHNTATDEVTVLDEPAICANQEKAWEEILSALAKAGQLTRAERAVRLHLQDKNRIDGQVMKRSADWSQVRPEWGLAGCTSFIIGERKITESIDLEGKSFLHSYDWKKDTDGSVLRSIMTAPMIVTSWINLQYYASTVDQEHFGAGNKALHNVTSGLGVIEGASGDLRHGLSWQSVHDGERYQHDPVRLQVFIQAPQSMVNEILASEPSVKNLCDHEWVKLWLLNDQGEPVCSYQSQLEWQDCELVLN